jgi:hypothetical protein
VVSFADSPEENQWFPTETRKPEESAEETKNQRRKPENQNQGPARTPWERGGGERGGGGKFRKRGGRGIE